MSYSSRRRPLERAHPAPPKDFLGAVAAELALAWAWAVVPLKRQFEAMVRDGIRPPTTFEGLPPGQFPPIDAIKDELFGRSDRPRRIAAPFEAEEGWDAAGVGDRERP